MKELLVISGKGGSGKTSLLASFALLAENAVLADCDVDAADLHLILAPHVESDAPFAAGREAVIRPDDCTGCGKCADVCRFDAVRTKNERYAVDPLACEGCGVCVRACPVNAIDFPEAESGRQTMSSTRAGPMAHARLYPGGENSGKLVSAVREAAKKRAEAEGKDLLLVDGPPGVGCPVIASLAGVDLALVVTEPTPSGTHDLLRVLDLTRHFGIRSAVCINKWDLHAGEADRIEALATERGAASVGRVGYGPGFTQAQLQGKAIVEIDDAEQAGAVRSVWERTQALLQEA